MDFLREASAARPGGGGEWKPSGEKVLGLSDLSPPDPALGAPPDETPSGAYPPTVETR
jgi:hypothetical protein